MNGPDIRVGDRAVLGQSPKVGDTIEGEAAYDALPIGAVVTAGGKAMLVKAAGVWVFGRLVLSDRYMGAEARTLAYLPETGDSE